MKKSHVFIGIGCVVLLAACAKPGPVSRDIPFEPASVAELTIPAGYIPLAPAPDSTSFRSLD